MECARCPFSLRCFAGRLDSEEPVTLCVKCGRLMACVENEFYRLLCERRPLLETHRAAFIAHRSKVSYPQRTMLAQVEFTDHGPGLSHKLVVHYCVGCTDNSTIKRVFGIVIDLDEWEKAKAERGEHIFELAGHIRPKHDT